MTGTSTTFPAGWRRAQLASLIPEDGVFADGDWIESKDQDPDGDVRLVQLADVGDGDYRNRSARFLTSKKAAELRCTFLAPGDVLVARMPDPLGRACIFPGDPKPSVTAVDVCIIRTGQGGPNLRWLCHFINTPQVRTQIAALQSGTTRKRISRSNLGTIELNVPPPAEQDRIVAEIEKQLTRLDAGVAALKRLQAHLQRYRAAVIDAAVHGRLVPTEHQLAAVHGTVCESAVDLLRRIQEERKAALGERKCSDPAAPDLDDVPEVLPQGWTWARAEQVCGFITKGTTPGASLMAASGPIPFIKVYILRSSGGSISPRTRPSSTRGHTLALSSGRECSQATC